MKLRAKSSMRLAVITLLVSSWANVAPAAVSTTSPTTSPRSGTEPSLWGFVGMPNAEWRYVSVPIDPSSDIGKLPNGQIYATCREKVMHYRFPVPDGLYTVRVHVLQAVGGATKNNAGVSVIANGKTIAENLEVYVPGSKQKALPPDIVATSREAEVACTNGQVLVFFPEPAKPAGVPSYQFTWALCGLEILGQQSEIRVNCGSKTPCTDSAGHVWESDWDRMLPRPAGQIMLEKRVMPKGEWVNISDEMLRKLGDDLGLEPVLSWGVARKEGLGVICDRSGSTYVLIWGLGLWRYEQAAGTLTRADAGNITSMGCPYGVSVNPDGPGFFWTGWCAFAGSEHAIRCLDGARFEPMANISFDFPAVDWRADPPVIFLMKHETGVTMLSTDGGKTFAQAGDDGKNLAATGALGEKVLIKWLVDGSVMRSADLGATWTKCAEVKLLKKNVRGAPRITRIGKAAYANTADGVYVSRDAGISWQLIPNSPALTQCVLRGKSDEHLIGFTAGAAYESTDGGATWKKTMEKPKGANVICWSYDVPGDVFYAQTDNGLYRCAQ